jgi:hypothetical protein
MNFRTAQSLVLTGVLGGITGKAIAQPTQTPDARTCDFWRGKLPLDQYSSVLQLVPSTVLETPNLDAGLIYRDRDALGAYNQKIQDANGLPLQHEFGNLFGSDLAPNATIQHLDKNSDGILNGDEFQGISNELVQKKFLAAAYVFDNYENPACKNLPSLPKVQQAPQIAGRPVKFVSVKSILGAQAEHHKEEVSHLWRNILIGLGLLGGIHFAFGRKISVWRRVGLFFAQKIFRREGTWFLRGVEKRAQAMLEKTAEIRAKIKK